MSPFSVEASVVILGKFSPSNRLLGELARVGALPAAELAAAEVVAILNQQVAEVAFGWGRLFVAAERLQVEVKSSPYVKGMDLAAKYMREIEPTSVARVAGVNTTVTYRFLDPVVRNQFAARLINFAGWGPWGKGVLASLNGPDIGLSGMTRVVVRDGSKKDERESGWTDVRIDPGPPHAAGFDVIVRVNDHYELNVDPPRSDTVGTAVLLEQVEKTFDASVSRALDIANGIVSN